MGIDIEIGENLIEAVEYAEWYWYAKTESLPLNALYLYSPYYPRFQVQVHLPFPTSPLLSPLSLTRLPSAHFPSKLIKPMQSHPQ